MSRTMELALGEDATSEQRLTEQWNEAEATFGIC